MQGSVLARFNVLAAVLAVAASGRGQLVAGDAFQYVLPEAGYVSRDRLEFPVAAAFGGLEYLPDGRLVTYDSLSGEVRIEGAITPLATFAAKPFGSFLILALDATALYFGENSTGDIYRIGLTGGEPELVDRINFNYDLAFDAAGRGFVSAPGLAGGNSIRLLDADPATESREVVTLLSGFSGPVAVDASGDVYYGTADGATPGDQRIYRFARDLIDLAIAGTPLESGDGELVLDELPGFYNLRLAGDRLLFSDLGFASGTGALRAIELKTTAPLATVATFQAPGGLCSPSFLALRSGSNPFVPGAGIDGGAVAVAYSDFASASRVAEILPELHFVRGRINDDQVVDLSDAVALLSFLFSGGSSPEVPEAADVNADSVTDLSDAIYILDFLFRGGLTIPAPFPEPGPAT